jgi:uncharacterized protein (TIGR00255 family)
MIRSMTGFGEAVGRTAAGTLRVELRAVNHRYLNLNARLPASLARWEPEIREWLRGSFSRGHVNCTARWEPDGEAVASPGYRLDDQKVASYLSLFSELSARHGVAGTPDLALLARFPDIIVRAGEDEPAAELRAEELRSIVEAAARQVVVMREEEGSRLEVDLRERIAAVEGALAEVERRAPDRLVHERRRLGDAVRELVGELTVDESRIAQEIVLLAERWDMHEELVRFRSHNGLFAKLLDAQGSEPVGKRLAFLVQEMHREANTMGAKANDAAISHLVVAIKDELERVREQVENVE